MENAPGLNLEVVVARIQQMMDPHTTVTHNEKLVDRVGNERQYDVVIRGHFGGRPILGVIECKDHSRKKGPDAVEAFAKKSEHLGANMRFMVSKKGFTPQALNLAKFENIGCLSLLPEDPQQAGFSIGDTFYGIIRTWRITRLRFRSNEVPISLEGIDIESVKWQGKLIIRWFEKEVFTKHQEDTEEGEFEFKLTFSEPRDIEIAGKAYLLSEISCIATRVYRKKKKWMNWSGDAFYDWHAGQFTIPGNGELVTNAWRTDMSDWQDYEGEVPEIPVQDYRGFVQGVVIMQTTWDSSKDAEVPDLDNL